MPLDPSAASRFASLALAGIEREYPHKPDHVLDGPDDFKPHRELHPAFYGSFDWHSAVHGHWTLVHLLRWHPGIPEQDAIREALDRNLTEAKILTEIAYFARARGILFERPYGWAWLLKLAEELHEWDDADGKRWAEALEPLALATSSRYGRFLRTLQHPNRVGTHANTAFALSFAWDYGATTRVLSLTEIIAAWAYMHFNGDSNYPARWEPGGEDFLSPALAEADLMTRIFANERFTDWFDRFLPGLGADGNEPFEPVTVSDRSDGRLVHLDGLNLSRAWCMKRIASRLPSAHVARPYLEVSARRHADAGLAHVTSGDYAGEHWLATFAVYLESHLEQTSG